VSGLVLVTGAAGFLGGNAVRYFSAAGRVVAGIGHDDRQQLDARKPQMLFWISGDISFELLGALTMQPDVIVHCAGGASVARSVADPEDDFRRTVDTTLSVLEYARLYAPNARIVLPSSAAVYGDVTRLPITEDAPQSPVSPYGLHKKLSEELCQRYAADFGLRIAIVRLFSVYGPGLRKQLLWDACEKLSRGDTEFFGTGEERRDWLHVDDAVSLLAVAAEKASEHCQIINGGSGQSLSVKEILLRLAAAFPTVGSLRFSGIVRQGDPIGYEADITRACAWQWRPRIALEQGIAEYVQWYREQLL
jgi:UDP-glucose 4-epimerase